MTWTSGLDILNKPIAKGTVFLIIGSPYYSKWFIDLKHMSYPISSPKAINATPSTAAIWFNESFSSFLCSAHN